MTEFAVISRRDVVGILARRNRPVVAIHTIRRDHRVVEISRHPSAGRMAEFAVVTRHDVVGIFARRGRTVVAAETVGGHDIVVKTRVFPATRPMAISAFVGARDMSRRFTRGRSPVVTGPAVVTNDPMIHPRGLPEAGDVTVVAIRLGRNMARRATRLRTIAKASMAEITLERRPGELSVHVAVLTGDVLVLSGQWESREVMIEGRRGLRRSHRRHSGRQDAREAKNKNEQKRLPARSTTPRHGRPLASIDLFARLEHRSSGDHSNPLLRPKVAGFQASSLWQSSQLRPNPPRCTSSAA